MKKLLLFILLCTSLIAADLQPVAVNDAAWEPLFKTLAAKGPVFASFTERRYSKLRKTPVVLEGEMRLSPDHGLSLRYVKPSERFMIIDARGILLRDDSGRTRELPADPRAPAMNAVLLPVLRFDLPALTQLFELRGARDGASWRLEFSPRDTGIARALDTLIVTGTDDAVRGLEFRPTPSQRIEISIGDTRTGIPFTPAELTQFFR